MTSHVTSSLNLAPKRVFNDNNPLFQDPADASIQRSRHPRTQTGTSDTTFHKKNDDSWEQRLVPGLGKECALVPSSPWLRRAQGSRRSRGPRRSAGGDEHGFPLA